MDCKHYGNINGMDPYAVGKEFAYIPQAKSKIPDLDPQVKLIVNPALRMRTEKFGSAVIVSGTFKSIITSDSARLLEELRGTTFTPAYVADTYKLGLDVMCRFLAGLHDQRVINLLPA